jgi:hypothetical protein
MILCGCKHHPHFIQIPNVSLRFDAFETSGVHKSFHFLIVVDRAL